ncbi:TauD/TfdA family dioxygenase [Amycolatopsis rubida]|uniref:Taurine dioxygenase, alpha-ketoglutarate-dependent n=1 Tax=Amycolatopsis rubida TaxID=112413 RepID=A0A1I5X9P2_9PSEU|nr:TauD/TfdA family dioxygenase [Amycolatopsis rubida]SFQ28690.1 Taurine dioxygenase, alpha-ketoglutarate-dependent [Amycolatopsis rubida]
MLAAPTDDPLSACRVDVAAAGGVDELAGVLARGGVALFDGVRGPRALLELADRLGAVAPHRDSGPTGLTVLTDREEQPGAGRTGFTNQALAPHTDCSDKPRPPQLVVMACAVPAASGGACVLVDGQAVHADLATTAPEALADLSGPSGMFFGGGAGIVGNLFEPQPGGIVGVRLRLDDQARFSPKTSEWERVLRAAIDRHTITFNLAAGAGYAVNNRRWLHGRHGFSGLRLMYRVLVEPRPEWRIPAGFAPAGTLR